MSVEGDWEEARRWLSQARADIRAAEGSLGLGTYEWACFQAQQAAEKALDWHGNCAHSVGEEL